MDRNRLANGLRVCGTWDATFIIFIECRAIRCFGVTECQCRRIVFIAEIGAYDKGKVKDVPGKTTRFVLVYEKCLQIITELKRELVQKNEASDLFGNERGRNFEAIISCLYQTFDGQELYQTLEDKATNLLYLTIKDHPFSDGNKRTAVFLFIYFLDKTKALYKETGEKKINDNALTALALLIAESDPKEKDVMISIVKNLISD